MICAVGKTPLLAIVSSSVAFFDDHKHPRSMSRIDKLHLFVLDCGGIRLKFTYVSQVLDCQIKVQKRMCVFSSTHPSTI